MDKEELLSFLEADGYKEIREVPGHGLCALYNFMFTLGLVVGLDSAGYKFRYCYPYERAFEAFVALKLWDGTGHPSGNWIKRKGEGGDFLNPNA